MISSSLLKEKIIHYPSLVWLTTKSCIFGTDAWLLAFRTRCLTASPVIASPTAVSSTRRRTGNGTAAPVVTSESRGSPIHTRYGGTVLEWCVNLNREFILSCCSVSLEGYGMLRYSSYCRWIQCLLSLEALVFLQKFWRFQFLTQEGLNLRKKDMLPTLIETSTRCLHYNIMVINGSKVIMLVSIYGTLPFLT